jgi:hypothetical protein
MRGKSLGADQTVVDGELLLKYHARTVLLISSNPRDQNVMVQRQLMHDWNT